MIYLVSCVVWCLNVRLFLDNNEIKLNKPMNKCKKLFYTPEYVFCISVLINVYCFILN